jgi:hypothetical protein
MPFLGLPFPGNNGRHVGSFQDFPTAMPKTLFFRTTESGGHQHGLDFQIDAARDVDDQSNTVANPAPLGPRPKFTDSAGTHVHACIGDISTQII